MLELQEEIAKAYAATKALRRDLTKAAYDAYFRTLGTAGSSGGGDFDAAGAKAQSVVKGGLLTANALEIVSGGREFDEKAVAGLALAFDAVALPLRIPHPPITRDPKILSLALAAVIGAFLGALGLAPLLRWAFDTHELGVALGGPLGAFLAVLVVHRLFRIRLLLRFLPGVGRGSRPTSGHARKDHESVVRASVEQYLDWAVLLLAALCMYEPASARPEDSREAAFRHIGKLIYALHRSPRESLLVVADELIEEAKNCGFEGLEGKPAFVTGVPAEHDVVVWSQTLLNKYETFGHVDEGDPVTVERPPVIVSGRIVERGLVRKVRDKA